MHINFVWPIKCYGLLVLALVLLAACDKHEQKEMDFSAIHSYDASGNKEGSNGDVSKQYVPETWDKWQYDLFLSSDTLARDTTVLANIKHAKLYCNPLADIARFSFYIDNKAMFRAVIIDKDKKSTGLWRKHVSPDSRWCQ